jgi:hypothetical protein
VPCTESAAPRPAPGFFAPLGMAAVCIALAACSGPASDRAPGEVTGPSRSAPATTTPTTVAPAAAETRRTLATPKPGRNWAEVRQQAAERLVAANPEITYLGRVPDQLLAIPVLEVELNGDGSVRRIEILREPREAKDTLKIAVEAVRRAAPFGDVSRLPRPWKFTETFLFDDARKFKPRTLDR